MYNVITINSESDLLIKCIKCEHQKIDHHRTAARDKMKCLIYKCRCKSFVHDRKYHRSTYKAKMEFLYQSSIIRI
jgi:hypothetical protein